MAKIIVLEFMTLDGVVEAPENWQFPYFSEDLAKANTEQIHTIDAQLLGRATYDIFAPSWSERTNNEFGIADKFNRMPKFVMTNTMDSAEWNNTSIINTVDEIAKLKAEFEGTIGIFGSISLIQSLMDTDIIDEYQLQIYPIVLGTGQRLFETGIPRTSLRLIETHTYSSGAIAVSYQPTRD